MMVRDRQTVADAAVEHCGDAEGIFAIVCHNDVEASAEPAHSELKDEDVIAKRAVEYMRVHSASPACAGDGAADVLTSDDEADVITTETGLSITE